MDILNEGTEPFRFKAYIPKVRHIVRYKGHLCKVMEVWRPLHEAKIWDVSQPVEKRALVVPWSELRFDMEGSENEFD
jgi:hypothetical protein